MKETKYHVVLLAATYQPFTPDAELLASLPEIKAPANYKDPVKIEEYILEATERRNAELGDLWPLKEFQRLEGRYYICDPLGESFVRDTGIGQIKDQINAARYNNESVQFLGIGVRDILRRMVVDNGRYGSAPIAYQMISDQRDIIDPLGLLDTGDVKKYLDPIYVLRRAGIDIPEGYIPHQSTETDCHIAVQFYNHFCRNGSRPELPLPALESESCK